MGGVIYEHFGLKKLSPTVGVYFYADEYIKFLRNLKHYLEIPLRFIPSYESKYYELLSLKKQTGCPIGVLDDVEIVFLHYKTEQEALEKWNRRVARVNYNNLIVKFSEMNLCEERHLLEFEAMDYRKVLFTKKAYPSISSAIVLPFYKESVSLLSDIHEYRFKMKEIKEIIGEKRK